MAVDSAVTMATRKVKAQNLESWKRGASWCLRLFLPFHSWGFFLPRAPLLSVFITACIHNFSIKDVLTVKNWCQTLLSKLKCSSGTYHQFHRYFPLFFFIRRRHVPGHLQRIFAHGIPQPREAETKECALPTLLQVVGQAYLRSPLERNKLIYLKSATATFYTKSQLGLHQFNITKGPEL